jgi:hypothetical protein
MPSRRNAVALVDCGECGRHVADSAEHCPNCGAARTKRWKTSDIIAAVVAALGILGFAFGLRQYWISENWKKREFVATQLKEFHSDKLNEAFLLILDYDPATRIELYPDKKEQNEKYADVSFNDLVAAISGPKPGTAAVEVRKIFEHFLQSLSRFNYYMAYDAIDPKELCQEFEYPVAVLTARQDVKEAKAEEGIDLTRLTGALEKYFRRWPHAYVDNFLKQINQSCPNERLMGGQSR